MNTQFCTDCGHSVAVDAKFCENCGAVFGNTTLTDLGERLDDSPVRPLPEGIKHVRVAISAWVVPFNATLVFGSTLIAVFDFLSPRVALLPIAATVAVVGLLAAIALRKFVAPSLPPDSTFRRALAPESRVHKSPVLIATGLLSALMVSGAAWSSAESTRGGIIASKFDAARNAQMQLGVMQGLQKEQRVQTAVLEDIREGRTLNPRRELANQGILWKPDDFHRAIQSGDKPVVSLFLAGGMQWQLSDAKRAKRLSSDAVLVLLLDNAQLLEKGDQCWSAIHEATYDKVTTLRELLKREPQSVPRLSPLDIRLMKLFCVKPADLTFAVEEVKRKEGFYAENVAKARKTDQALGPAPGTVRTLVECKADLTASNAKVIQSALSGYVITEGQAQGGYPFRFSLSPGETLLNRAKANGGFVLDAKGRAEIDDYCQSDKAKGQSFDSFEHEMLKQVLAALG